MRGFLTKLVLKYGWVWNEFLKENHPVSMTLYTYGFRRAHRRMRRFFHVWYKGGRLCGVYVQHVKKEGDLFSTGVRVLVYADHEAAKTNGEEPEYFIVFQMASVLDGMGMESGLMRTENFKLKDMATSMKAIQASVVSQGDIFRIKHKSRVRLEQIT